MIRAVCCVDAGKRRVRAYPHLEESPAECSAKRTYDHCCNTPDHYGQTFEPA
jgi:hypothetical protein